MTDVRSARLVTLGFDRCRQHVCEELND